MSPLKLTRFRIDTLTGKFGTVTILILAVAANLFSQAQDAPQTQPTPQTQQTPPIQAGQQSARELLLTVGKSLIVNSAVPIERVAVGFGDFAEAKAISPTEVLLNGKAPGETTLIIWQEGGNKLFFDVIVRANTSAARNKLETLQSELQKYLPGQDINATIENDTVFLQGTVKDLNSADRALAIAATASAKIVNLLYVPVPPTDSQILLKVKFASLDRSVTTDLGLNLFSTGATNTVGRVTTGQYPGGTVAPGTPGTPTTVSLSDALNIFLLRPDLNLAATIKALENRGLAEVLAEPNVLAINGKQANFLAGGEFPYPILQGGGGGLGAVTVAFRQFGVRIDFLPLLTSRGTVRLSVAPEVSALDFTAGLNIQGFTIPGLATRRVETEIEVQPGQSFVIGGLLDRRLNETIEKIPLLANIPLLGKLFQSRALNKSNNELLVLITPEIVRPIPAGQTPPSLDFPQPLMGPDKQIRTPGTDVTGAAAAPAGQLVPVEELMRDLKSQSELKLQQRSTVSTWPGATQMPTPTAPAPPTAPPSPPKQ